MVESIRRLMVRYPEALMAGADERTVIVGGGLAGLCCARRLSEARRACVVLEASDGVGGRVRTDELPTEQGRFLLDRGFQVLLTAYPEAQRVLRYPDLKLREFYPGALVRVRGEFHRIADPRRRPLEAARGFLSPVAKLADKALVAQLYARTRLVTTEAIWERPNEPTIDRLRSIGFSEAAIDRFFRPFFGGVFLDRELRTSSRIFEFLFRMFACGDTALPDSGRGMAAVPEQVASSLPEGTVRLNAAVASVAADGRDVRLASGEVVRCTAVVIATEADTARGLAGHADHGTGGGPPPEWNGTVTLYFDAPADQSGLLRENILALDGDGQGPVNHVCAVSAAAPSYAPPGRALISASVIGVTALRDEELTGQARSQLGGWFGPCVDQWRFLRAYRLPRALPRSAGRAAAPSATRVRPGVYVTGDHLAHGSIDGAMAAGRAAAEALLADSLPLGPVTPTFDGGPREPRAWTLIG